MISHLARLRAKKGFTIVELVVVVSIIAILIAMVIPMVYYDTKPAVAKSMAKDMYYKAQEVLTDCRAIQDGLIADNYTCYFAVFDKYGKIPQIDPDATPPDTRPQVGKFTVDSYMASPTDPTPSYMLAPTVISDRYLEAEPKNIVDKKMKEMMVNYLVSDVTRDMTGILVAVCDKKYRVVAAYWFEDYDFTAGMKFFDECILDNGNYCCAYPSALCAPGARSYKVIDVLY